MGQAVAVNFTYTTKAILVSNVAYVDPLFYEITASVDASFTSSSPSISLDIAFYSISYHIDGSFTAEVLGVLGADSIPSEKVNLLYTTAIVCVEETYNYLLVFSYDRLVVYEKNTGLLLRDYSGDYHAAGKCSSGGYYLLSGNYTYFLPDERSFLYLEDPSDYENIYSDGFTEFKSALCYDTYFPASTYTAEAVILTINISVFNMVYGSMSIGLITKIVAGPGGALILYANNYISLSKITDGFIAKEPRYNKESKLFCPTYNTATLNYIHDDAANAFSMYNTPSFLNDCDRLVEIKENHYITSSGAMKYLIYFSMIDNVMTLKSHISYSGIFSFAEVAAIVATSESTFVIFGLVAGDIHLVKGTIDNNDTLQIDLDYISIKEESTEWSSLLLSPIDCIEINENLIIFVAYAGLTTYYFKITNLTFDVSLWNYSLIQGSFYLGTTNIMFSNYDYSSDSILVYTEANTTIALHIFDYTANEFTEVTTTIPSGYTSYAVINDGVLYVGDNDKSYPVYNISGGTFSSLGNFTVSGDIVSFPSEASVLKIDIDTFFVFTNNCYKLNIDNTTYSITSTYWSVNHTNFDRYSKSYYPPLMGGGEIGVDTTIISPKVFNSIIDAAVGEDFFIAIQGEGVYVYSHSADPSPSLIPTSDPDNITSISVSKNASKTAGVLAYSTTTFVEVIDLGTI